MAKDRGRSGKRKVGKEALVEAVTDLVSGSKRALEPLSKGAGKEIRKLEKRLDAARATETKRLRQLAAAQATKGRKQVAKRSKQAGEAAQEVASLAGKLAGLAASAAGSAAGATGGAARAVGTAAIQAVEAVSPVRTGTPAVVPAAPAAAAKTATAKGVARRPPRPGPPRRPRRPRPQQGSLPRPNGPPRSRPRPPSRPRPNRRLPRSRPPPPNGPPRRSRPRRAGPPRPGRPAVPTDRTEVPSSVRRRKRRHVVLTTRRLRSSAMRADAATTVTAAVETRDHAVGASVDLGSNSVHLLVAAIAGHRLDAARRRIGLPRARRRRRRARLPGRARPARELVATLVRLRRHGSRASVPPTSRSSAPSRSDARPTPRAIVARGRRGGRRAAPRPVATRRRRTSPSSASPRGGRSTHETLVVDVGGGSSEFCVVDADAAPAGRRPPARLGAADRPVRRRTIRRPPAEVAAMRAAAVEAVRGAPDASPAEIVAVGGTASNLLKVLPAGGARPDADARADRRGDGDPRGRAGRELAAERYLINPIRARILPAGGGDPGRDPRALRGRPDPRLRGRHPRGHDPGRRPCRAGLARSPGELAHGWRPDPRSAPSAPARRVDGRRRLSSPATTRPSVRRKPIPATPRQAGPIVRRSRATSRSRLTR